jgi:alkylation response protein AidB-like acyl-CoA dehydrogenase
MNFDPSDVQLAWKGKGASLGQDLAADAAAADVVMGAARVGLLDPQADLLALALAVEALAFGSPSSAIAFALHTGAVMAVGADARFASLLRGEAVGALALSSDEVPVATDGRLTGRAAWVAPITDRGVAVVGARTRRPAPADPARASDPADVSAFAVSLDAAGVTVEPLRTAALRGFVCAHVTFDNTPAIAAGATVPVMARVRVLIAAAGLGMGRRALREALDSAKRTRAASAWEETVQGLLADAATDLDAAMMLTWKAAADLPAGAGSHGAAEAGSHASPSLAAASMAKLAAGAAAQHAVERATQVIGADSFQRGHIVERLAQDVRALELFAGRTEALRAAAAAELLPRT